MHCVHHPSDGRTVGFISRVLWSWKKLAGVFLLFLSVLLGFLGCYRVCRVWSAVIVADDCSYYRYFVPRFVGLKYDEFSDFT